MREPRSQGARNVVLVVDDDEDCRTGVKDALEPLGYDVMEAPDGLAALDVCRRSRPSVILLDGIMPVMTGPQFIEVQRGDPHLATIPVVLLTGSPSQMPAGVLVLTKPASRDDLLRALRGASASARP